MKLIWDFVGTEFGGRQLQYEMFYSASQPVVNRRMFRSYDWDAAEANGRPLPRRVLMLPPPTCDLRRRGRDGHGSRSGSRRPRGTRAPPRGGWAPSGFASPAAA